MGSARSQLSEMPMPELEEFAERARMVAQQTLVDRAAVTALQAFEAAGIEALVLKGPVLARTLYLPDEHRGYFDLDLLVHPNDRLAAGEVLTGLGYVDFVKTSGLRVFPDDPHADLWVQRTDRSLTPVDLHWRLPGCEADEVRLWEALRARRAWVELDGLRAPTLDRAGLSLHLGLHAAQHGPEDRKAMGDLKRGLDRWPVEVWQEAAELAAEVGAQEAFAAGLRLLPAGAALAEPARPAAGGKTAPDDRRARAPAAGHIPLASIDRGRRPTRARFGAALVALSAVDLDPPRVPVGARQPAQAWCRLRASFRARTALGDARLALPALCGPRGRSP